jgi:hypothetical protein
VEEVIAANDAAITLATTKIDSNQVEVSRVIVQRPRDNGSTAPPAPLSYNNIIAMNPGSKGRHDMSNQEWERFKEETRQ